jgi:peptide/nickel transport system permease protein
MTSARHSHHAARDIARPLIEHPPALVSLIVLACMLGFCFLGPLLYHSNTLHTNLAASLQPPGPGRPLGTDEYGFDELGRLMQGGQTSIIVGVTAALCATVFGALWGALAGLAGGVVDVPMMRIVDGLYAIPTLFVVIVVSRIVTLNLFTLILLVSYSAWLAPARLVRAETLSIRTRDYVHSVTLMGGGTARKVIRHVIPNTLGTIAVNSTFQVADAVLTVAALGYLGVGLPEPRTDWGSMLSNGIQAAGSGGWWVIYPPGIAIVLVVVSLNFLGDFLARPA